MIEPGARAFPVTGYRVMRKSLNVAAAIGPSTSPNGCTVIP